MFAHVIRLFMGFFSGFVKGAAKSVGNTIKDAHSLSQQWENKDRAFILDKYKNGTAAEQMAASKVAKDRGWKR